MTPEDAAYFELIRDIKADCDTFLKTKRINSDLENAAEDLIHHDDGVERLIAMIMTDVDLPAIKKFVMAEIVTDDRVQKLMDRNDALAESNREDERRERDMARGI